MKILFFTDTHIRGNSPVNRIDWFPASLAAKLAEVVDIANDSGVDLVLHGGDVFDTPNPALPVVADYLRILQGFRAPLYVLAGNHDMYGGNIATLPRSVLGFIGRVGLLNLMTGSDGLRFEARGIRAYIKGSSYHMDMDRRSRHLDYLIPKDQESDVSIHMIHGMLFDKTEIPGDHTLIDDIIQTEADLTLAGHNHLGFGIINKAGRYFVNPGAIARLSNHYREISRPVQVAIIDLTGGAISCRLVPLSKAEHGPAVLDRSKRAENEARFQAMENFTREVRSATVLKRWDVGAMVNDIAQAENLEDKVRREALRRISLASESLDSKGGLS